jgi:hypothetical protein
MLLPIENGWSLALRQANRQAWPSLRLGRPAYLTTRRRSNLALIRYLQLVNQLYSPLPVGRLGAFYVGAQCCMPYASEQF